MINRVFALLFSLAIASPCVAQETYSRVQIHAPADRTAFAALAGFLQLDHFDYTEDGLLVVEISSSELQRLRQTPYKFKILSHDIVAELRGKNHRYLQERAGSESSRLPFEETGSVVSDIIKTPDAFEVKATLGGYYSFAQMVTAMNELVAAYPGIASMTSIGKTAGNRDIWVIKISDHVGDDENEPEVLFVGLQHAREAIGGSSMIFFMQYLCEQYALDTRVKDLVDNREIFIIPCMNPDGWEYNRTQQPNGGGQWRKNRNGSGVDLNRNWGVDWGNCSSPIVGDPGSCGSSNPNDGTYYGPNAFSELETQHIRQFTLSRRLVAMIDQHAYGPYYSLPFGRPSLATNVMAARDAKFYTWVPAAMGKYNGMRAGNSPESVGYEVAGGVKDWMLKGEVGVGTKGKVYGMTGEGGYGTASLTGTFWPPMEQIIRLCKGMIYQNLQLLYAAGTHIDLTDLSDVVLNDNTGNLSFRALRVGLGNLPVTVSLMPLENIQSVGSPVTIASAELPNYYDSHTSSISYTLSSGIKNGQRIRFVWKVEEGGLTFYDTITKFYHANPALLNVVNDNMNTGSAGDNWTINSGWGYSASGTGYGGVGRAFTESPSGNYPGSANRTAMWKNPVNLSDATAAHLSFWVRHRIENFRDRLQVQVSVNGTGGPWVALKGNITIQEPGTLEGSNINGAPSITGIREEWVRAMFDLEPYIGNNEVYFRFQFTSDASNSSGFNYRQDDGAYIDDVQLTKTTVALQTLPVVFKNFNGKLLTNETICLDWSAEVDQQHNYFEVEKKINGTAFVSIGRASGAAPWVFIDENPVVGNNYYRIKQMDKDGSVSYSVTINVVYYPDQFQVEIYPNPVQDWLRVEIKTATRDQYRVRLTDLSGKILYEEKNSDGVGSQEWLIPVQNLPSQLLLVTVLNRNGTVLAREKVMK